MLLTQLAAVLATSLVLGTSAGPVPPSKRQVPATHVLHERHQPHHTAHWSKRSKVPSSALLPVRIGLTQGNLDAGHDRLLAILDTNSEHYGKHMTPEEVIEFFAPPQSIVDNVTDWISSSGISKERIGHSTNKQWIQFDATAEEVENLLYAEFHVYEHADGSKDVSTEAYHLPENVREHIDYITPGTRLRAIKGRGADAALEKRAWKPARVGSGHIPAKAHSIETLDGQTDPFTINSTTCDVAIVADCLRHQYGIPKLTQKPQAGNELGIFESLDSHYSKKDLDVTWHTLYPHEIPNGTYPIERNIDGAIGSVESQPPGLSPPITSGDEAMLDFGAAIPLIYPQKTVAFQTDDEFYERDESIYFGFYNTFLDAIDGSYCTYDGGNCKTDDCLDPIYPNNHTNGYKGGLQCGVYRPTTVISFSYGATGMPDRYVQRQCREIMKLGLQGTTFVSSSGDDGVGNPQQCGLGAEGQGVFYTSMLAECPYVLSVGSTELTRPASSSSSPSARTTTIVAKSGSYPTAVAHPPKQEPYPHLDEIATRDFGSGGGFSNAFEAPEWQKAAIRNYFAKTKLPFSGYDVAVKDSNFTAVQGKDKRFYKHGRGFPDVAAVGLNQVVYMDGLWYLFGGTSLSAPIVASMVTLANEERMRAGKRPVGFFTPALYAHPEVLHDITVGSNPGCNTTGFPAAKGWDPVTGGGSINFPKFVDLLKTL